MPRTLGDQAKKLAEFIRNIDAAEARRRINLAYLTLSERHPWQHRLKRFTLQTEASYSTGTVAVSGTAVTGTGTTWVTSWVTAPSMRRIAVQGRSEPYDVSAISGATGLTIADTWLGSSDSGLTYRLFRDRYPLPTDCGYAKLMALYDPEIRQPLIFMHQPRFISVRNADPTLVSIPECFTVVEMTSEAPPRPQIQIYPAASTVRAYHGWYFNRPTLLSTDASYFEWPAEFDDMLWQHAAIEHYETPTFYSPKFLQMLKPKFADQFSRMKVAMDGQNAIDFRLGEMVRAGGGTWNPNVLGLSGEAMTDWN